MNAAGIRSKAEWRKALRARRDRLDPKWVGEASRAIADRAGALPELEEAASVAAFLALPNEPSLDALIAHLLDRGATVCVPAYDEDLRRYRLCHLEDGSSRSSTEVGRVPRTSRAESPGPGSAGTRHQGLTSFGAVQGGLPRPTCASLHVQCWASGWPWC